jgi:hypothetical protein
VRHDGSSGKREEECGTYRSGSGSAALLDGGGRLRDAKSLIDTRPPTVGGGTPSRCGLADLVLLVDLLGLGLEGLGLGVNDLRDALLLCDGERKMSLMTPQPKGHAKVLLTIVSTGLVDSVSTHAIAGSNHRRNDRGLRLERRQHERYSILKGNVHAHEAPC